MGQPSPKAIASASSSPVAAGAFVNALNGQIVANGYLMAQYHTTLGSILALSGGGEVVNRPVQITLDANGKPSAGQSMYVTDQFVNQIGIDFYVFDTTGNLIGSTLNASVTGAVPVDITQITGTASGSIVTPVITNPNTQQTINGQDLVIEGAALGFSAASSTTGDAFINRQAANVIGIGTTDVNASGTVRASIVQIGGSDTGLSRDSAGVIDAGNGTQGDKTGTLNLTTLGLVSAGVAKWSTDTGLSRTAASTVAVGNGSQGDASGILKAAGIGLNGAGATAGVINGTVGWQLQAAGSAVVTINSASISVAAVQGPGFQKQVFTSSGTFTISTGITQVKVTVVGGGGGGGGCASAVTTSSAGGGGGGTAIKWLTGLTPGNTLTVTVGGGGNGGTAGANNGVAGTSSTVASGTQTISTITGGGGGLGTAGNSAGGSGGTSSGGDINITGGGGGYGFGSVSFQTPGGYGGGTFLIGPTAQGSGGAGSAGIANTGQGGQGAAANSSASAGGNGGSGLVIFEWVS